MTLSGIQPDINQENSVSQIFNAHTKSQRVEESRPGSPDSSYVRAIGSPISHIGMEIRKATDQQLTSLRSMFASLKRRLSITSAPEFTPAIDYERLSEVYGSDFVTTPINPGLRMIRELLFKIELCFLSSKMNLATLCMVREHVKKILPNSDTVVVLSELGVIYFYLDKFDFITCEQNFLQCRLLQIEDEIRNLKYSGTQELPTGVPTYLLRAFSNMVIDTKGKVNKGGVVAVHLFLEGKFSQYFKEDHKTHIVTVLKQLLEDQNLDSALEAQIVVSPYMEIFIRIDLKVAITEKLTIQHVKVACLLALLFDIRQFHHPNCYAVATLIYGMRNHPEIILKKYQEFLQDGWLRLTTSEKISIFELFSKRVIDDEGLNVCLTPDQAKLSPLVNIALRALGLNANVLDSICPSACSVGELMRKASQLTPCPEASFFVVSSMIGSFKKNAFQEMFLAVLEFQEANRSFKSRFMQFIHQVVLKDFDTLFAEPEAPNFFKAFAQLIENRFWIHERSCKVGHTPDGHLAVRLATDWIQILNFFGDRQALQQSIKRHRRLIYIKDSRPVAVNSIVALSNCFAGVLDEITKLAEYSEFCEKCSFIAVFFKGCLLTLLPAQIASFVYEVNKASIPFTIEHYKSSGLVFFESNGGNTLEGPFKTLGFTYKTKVISAGSPTHNVYGIFNYFFSLPNKKEFQNSRKLALCISSNHAFVLQPYAFFSLIETDPENVLKFYSVSPFAWRMNSPISLEKRKAVLVEVFKDIPMADLWLQHFCENMTGTMFYAKFLSSAEPLFHKAFFVALEKEVTKIPSNSIPWSLLIGKLFPSLNAATKLQYETQAKASLLNIPELRAFEIANRFQQVLASLGKFISNMKLEMLICQELIMPMAWTFGDLNYGNFVESPHHEVLVYKIMPDGFQIFTRRGDLELPVHQQLLHGMTALTIIHQ